jgi:hypothetical protein
MEVLNTLAEGAVPGSSKPNSSKEAYFYREEVRALLLKLQEATRATPKGEPSLYIPPPGGEMAEANYHHFVFGQRGSGKSSLLRHLEARLKDEGRITVWTDAEIFSALDYPDVLVSAVIEVLKGVRAALVERVSDPSQLAAGRRLGKFLEKLGHGGRRNERLIEIIDRIDKIAASLEAIKFAPKDRKIEWSQSRGSGSRREAYGSVRLMPVELKAGGTADEGSEIAIKEIVESSKAEYLERLLVDLRQLLAEASEYCNGGFVFLDDFYHLRKLDQPLVLGYIHRLIKDTGLWLKIGSIRYSTVPFRQTDRPIGIQPNHDAQVIALDGGIRLFDTTKRFLETILMQLAQGVGVEMQLLITSDARKRLMLASGGVARDYLRLTAGAIGQARERGPSPKSGTNRIIVEDINKAAGTIAPSKLDDLKEDAPEEVASLQALVLDLTEFCRRSKRAYFLVDSGDAELSRAMDALQHHRYAYLLAQSETIPDAESQRFNVWLLDIAQLSAQRATQGMDFDKWSRREERRSRNLIYLRNWRETIKKPTVPRKVGRPEPKKVEPKKPTVTTKADDAPTLFDAQDGPGS